MLQLARQEIEKNGLLEQYRLVHSPVQSIGKHLQESVDVLMFHAVMEWLVDPQAALQYLLNKVKPGGAASIMFYNHHGLVYKNVVCGNIPMYWMVCRIERGLNCSHREDSNQRMCING